MARPKPLTEAGATRLEAQLLLAGQQQRLPEAERQAIWTGIAAGLPAAPPGHLAPSTGASLAGSGLVKAMVAVAMVGASAAVGYQVLRPGESPRRLEQTTWVSPPKGGVPPSAPSAEVVEPSLARDSSSVKATAEARAPAAAPPATLAASQLGEESVAVLGIRQALRSGDYGLALKLLEQARGRFPRGALGQEREALMIEALARSGARAAAERRAAAFLRAYPKSPYATDVQRYADH